MLEHQTADVVTGNLKLRAIMSHIDFTVSGLDANGNALPAVLEPFTAAWSIDRRGTSCSLQEALLITSTDATVLIMSELRSSRSVKSWTKAPSPAAMFGSAGAKG